MKNQEIKSIQKSARNHERSVWVNRINAKIDKSKDSCSSNHQVLHNIAYCIQYNKKIV
jgi:hypothetical protein